MHSVKYPDLSHLHGELDSTEFKEKIKIDVERGNVLINKAILQHDFLQREGKTHSSLMKRYRRLCRLAVCTEVALTSLEVALSGMAVVSSPVLPIFGVFALGAATTKLIEVWLQKKLTKHREYALLASSKVKSLEENFIKSMDDGVLTGEEYKIIKKEVELYLKYKNKIKETNASVISVEEQELLNHIRKLRNSTNILNGIPKQNNEPSAPPSN